MHRWIIVALLAAWAFYWSIIHVDVIVDIPTTATMAKIECLTDPDLIFVNGFFCKDL